MGGAGDVKKCLESAIANAENNHDLDVDALVVAEAHVGNGIVEPTSAKATLGGPSMEFKIAIWHPNHVGI